MNGRFSLSKSTAKNPSTQPRFTKKENLGCVDVMLWTFVCDSFIILSQNGLRHVCIQHI